MQDLKQKIAAKLAELKAIGITDMTALAVCLKSGTDIRTAHVGDLYTDLKWLRAEESSVCIGWDPNGE